jgi:DNA-binding MarR family transcriptional regulator
VVLFGVLTCASVPFYIQPGVPAGSSAQATGGAPDLPVLGGFSGLLVHRYLGYYWPAALLAGLLLTLLWYRRNARRVGLQTPARGYLITAEAQRAEFGYLRGALGLTPGNLSKHLTVLEEAGMIQVEKGYAGRRPRTWVRITRQGRAALAAELAALAELLKRHGTTHGQP